MKFFRSRIDKGEDIDIDKELEKIDAGKKKKYVKSKKKTRCKGSRR